MTLTQLVTTLVESSNKSEQSEIFYGHNGHKIKIYQRSVRIHDDILFFIGRENNEKYLYSVANSETKSVINDFDCEPIQKNIFGYSLRATRCLMNHKNSKLLRELFPFTRPVLMGLADSFGFGDRLGIANPAHLRSLVGSHMRPVLAQQSIRELERTQRTAEDVLDAASWAVFQEGYTGGFGADADHLKTIEDIDRYARAGFTMFTFDPSAYVVNEAAKLPIADVLKRLQDIDTGNLQLDEVLSRYVNRSIKLSDDLAIETDKDFITRVFLKYAGVVAHTVRLYKHLKHTYPSLPTEVEMSVDETDSPTTPFEHFFIASELKREGVQFVSLAPRFIGDFEKGVDYRGDINLFAAEYKQHASIAQMVGPYKISIHSGSDKFGVYKIRTFVHEKGCRWRLK
ncbi:MAG: tagaturonate epimerase family protein [Bacteroidota bacterium]|nr:tagaturonate epimerase family protein [Bacteroidota bacterium]